MHSFCKFILVSVALLPCAQTYAVDNSMKVLRVSDFKFTLKKTGLCQAG